jgi:DNA-binding beta-propeller fold protein YncE
MRLTVMVGGLGLLLAGHPGTAAELMLSANDQKVTWDDAGKVVASAPGQDTVSIIDIGTDPDNPKIVVDLPLMNSIFGPPTNLAITPDGKLALVANSMRWVQDGAAWKPQPDNKVHVIDLEASPPAPLATVGGATSPPGWRSARPGTSPSSPTAPARTSACSRSTARRSSSSGTLT